ncbi:hypothetical protein U9M48_015568 [Paspalum notatum var. saurae]|uniref:F-box domain-containing protein n=1 Tax=Paspalum notatum var. saurae TaxID=547442 RepID=A0AAQ3T3W3_PASNO
MALPAPRKANRQAWPPLLTLTDDLLEDVFLRVPTPADLSRACIACATFRRIITGLSFLRRFRAIHPPPLLGFIPWEESGFLPAQPPYPSAPLARAVAEAADFSYSFVPDGKWNKPWSPWVSCDVRQGRVLLKCCRVHDDISMSPLDVELVVCDPIFRRYVVLPPLPGDLVVAHDDPNSGLGHLLAPTGEDEEETSFRLIFTAANHANLVAFVYSSVTGHCISQLEFSGHCLAVLLGRLLRPDYSQGCFFWTSLWRERSLVLDSTRMEFSIVHNVPYRLNKLDSGGPAIFVGAEGTPEMFFLSHSHDLLQFHVKSRNEPSDRWQLRGTIPLPGHYYKYYVILGAAEGFLFIRAMCSFKHPCDCCFLDTKTRELKKVCGCRCANNQDCLSCANAFFGFPPSLSRA